MTPERKIDHKQMAVGSIVGGIIGAGIGWAVVALLNLNGLLEWLR